MKKIIIILLFPVLACCCGNQPRQQTVSPPASETDIAMAVDQLMQGFTSADENLLKSVTADALVYGHSSGVVQNKSEFIEEIISRKPLVYVNTELSNQSIQINGDIAIVRHIFMAETKNVEGEPGSLKIGVMQIWQLQNGMWKLLARQAYKI